jgi:hypothetical protein
MGVFIGFFERFWLVFSKKHSLLQHAYLYSVTSTIMIPPLQHPPDPVSQPLVDFFRLHPTVKDIFVGGLANAWLPFLLLVITITFKSQLYRYRWVRRIHLLFQGEQKLVLSFEKQQTKEQNATHNLLYKAENAVPFEGRTSEIEELAAFKNATLPTKGKFIPLSIWSIAGKGGQGKSRLAFEFCLQNPMIEGQDNLLEMKQTKRWDGWYRGFVGMTDTLPNMADWRPKQPTFIVMDETPADETTVKRLEAMAQASPQYCHPVRVLLLWRNDADLHFTHRENTSLYPCLYKNNEPLLLEPLKDDDLRKLFNKRAGLPDHDQTTFKKIMDGFKLNTAELQRTLFVLYMADYHNDPKTDKKKQYTLNDVLKYALEEKDRKTWKKQAETLKLEDTDLESVEAKLHSATLLGGLNKLNLLTDKKKKLYTAMVGGTNYAQMYPPLLPDVLGSYYLLQVYATACKKGCTTWTGEDRATLETKYQQAWEEAPALLSTRFKKVVDDMTPVTVEVLTTWALAVLANAPTQEQQICLNYLVKANGRMTWAYAQKEQADPCLPYIKQLESLKEAHPTDAVIEQLANNYRKMTYVYETPAERLEYVKKLEALQQFQLEIIFVKFVLGCLILLEDFGISHRPNQEETIHFLKALRYCCIKWVLEQTDFVIEQLATAYANMTVVCETPEQRYKYAGEIKDLKQTDVVIGELGRAYYNTSNSCETPEKMLVYVNKIKALKQTDEVIEQLAKAYHNMTVVYETPEKMLVYVNKIKKLEQTDFVIKRLAKAYVNMAACLQQNKQPYQHYVDEVYELSKSHPYNAIVQEQWIYLYNLGERPSQPSVAQPIVVGMNPLNPFEQG